MKQTRNSKSPKLITGRQLYWRWKDKGWDLNDLQFVRLIDHFDLLAYDPDTGSPAYTYGTKNFNTNIFEEDLIDGMQVLQFDTTSVERMENEDPELLNEMVLGRQRQNGKDHKKSLRRWERRLDNILVAKSKDPFTNPYLKNKKEEVEKEINDVKAIIHSSKGYYNGFISGVRDEIETIYKAISKLGFNNHKPIDYRKEALRMYRKHKKQFQYVKKQHLDDIEIYNFSVAQQKRQFGSAIFKKIIDEYNIKGSGQKLWMLSVKSKRST